MTRLWSAFGITVLWFKLTRRNTDPFAHLIQGLEHLTTDTPSHEIFIRADGLNRDNGGQAF